MGSYENIVKIEEMRRKTDDGDYLSAQKILDTMSHKKVKNLADLGLMADIYTNNERYDEAMELLLRIYQKTKTRKIIFQMIEISIKNNKPEDAEQYLTEYVKIAPKDFYKYIFRFRIGKLKQEPFETLIETLESLKEEEYLEKWGYELAKLYYKAGREEDCIRECSDIILWFGEGTYVEKAKLLKAYYSGETGKDEMLEELKRRAAGEKRKDIPEPTEEVSEEEHKEIVTDLEQDSIFDNEYSVIDTESEYSIDNLKQDVENILTEDAEGVSAVACEPSVIMSEQELAEREVEETIYKLLVEEEMGEEDKWLKDQSNELGLDLENIFCDFLHVKQVKKQLVESLEIIIKEPSQSIQMMITGSKKSGKTALAKDLTIFFNKIGRLKTTRIAKINADKLNHVDLMAKKATLKDCCFIIEDASELKKSTIDKLLDLIQYFHGDIIVILEDEKKNMNKLFRECPKLMDLIKNRIHLPEYTTEDLLGFSEAYAARKDFDAIP
ncbi:MAG: hypothetical protein K0S76_1084 [Herbinix sp.]|jgi:hypothetical protein|nr:hypothetical protein [Herbinix sp.]